MVIKFFAGIKEIIGKKRLNLDLPDIDHVGELLNYLIENYGIELKKIFYEKGEFKGDITILINGKNIRFLDGVETEINDSDIISIILPLCGG